MNDQSHLLMSLSYTPADPRVPEEMRKAAARLEQLEAALRFYAEHPITGNRARAALEDKA